MLLLINSCCTLAATQAKQYVLCSEAFKRDTSGDKLNLGVGAYRTEELQPYMLEVVKRVCAPWPGTALSALSLGQITVSARWVIRHAVYPEKLKLC